MKNTLLVFLFISFSYFVSAQQDTTGYSVNRSSKKTTAETQGINVNIYPVPVRESNFTIESDREFISVKITNVIGQDIYRTRFTTPQNLLKIFLDNPQRGMYIVTIAFADETRIVRKIMVEAYN